jgi:hypothetical protein
MHVDAVLGYNETEFYGSRISYGNDYLLLVDVKSAEQ